MKILFWDTETTPISGYTWGLWDQNIGLSQIISVTEIMCWGARWYDKKQVMVMSTHKEGKDAMLEGIWNLLNEADAVVSWNGASFDTKHIMREFIQAGMKPPSPYKEIDLMRVVKQRFKAPSNKLDYWAGLLLNEHKTQHTGFQLWKDCMAGDERAWRLMYKYQKQDVNLLVDLYDKLLPWINNHPNKALYDGVEGGCPACASLNLQKRGVVVTSVSKYQRYQCQDCGKWLKSNKRIGSDTLSAATS